MLFIYVFVLCDVPTVQGALKQDQTLKEEPTDYECKFFFFALPNAGQSKLDRNTNRQRDCKTQVFVENTVILANIFELNSFSFVCL